MASFFSLIRDYDAEWVRRRITGQATVPSIPNRAGKKRHSCFSAVLYEGRDLVERFFDKIEYCRRIATRYDKLGSSSLPMVKLAAIGLWLRFYGPTARIPISPFLSNGDHSLSNTDPIRGLNKRS